MSSDFHILDTVEMTDELAPFKFRRGDVGTILELFGGPPEAAMIEFVGETGESLEIADYVPVTFFHKNNETI